MKEKEEEWCRQHGTATEQPTHFQIITFLRMTYISAEIAWETVKQAGTVAHVNDEPRSICRASFWY